MARRKTRSPILAASVLCILASPAAPQQSPSPPAGAEILSLLHSSGLDETECYRVRDLDLSKEDLRLYFNEGYLIFAKPIHGERWAAVFSGEVEGGDGEVLLLPPYRGERQSLAKFTQTPNLDEHFASALLLFSDGSGDALLSRIERENRDRKSPEMGPLLAERWNAALSNIAIGFELRLAGDLLTPPASRHGLVFATVAGKKLGNFDVFYDSHAGEQILAGRLVEHNSSLAYDIWTSFPARSSRAGGPPLPAAFDSDRFQIEAELDANLRLKASTHISLKIGANPVRVLPFEISRAIEITTARIDGAPAELVFNDSPRERALRTDENDAFLLISSRPLEPGSAHRIDFEETGSVITPAGKDVYFVGARASWYPRSGVEVSVYDLSFRYPKRLTLVTPGDVMEDRVEGEWRYTRRVTPVPIRVAGFNLGDYEKVAGTAQGFHVQVYGNRALEASLQPRIPVIAPDVEQARAAVPPGRGARRTPLVQLPPPPPPAPPDPLARLHSVAEDVSSSLEMFSGWFGPPGMRTLTVSPIPGTFGQGFPGLVYLSTLAYLDPSARPPSARGPREQTFFSDLMQAHEVAHQWWGDLVLPATYQDEWIPEALSNYSALLYLEKRRGSKAMRDVLEDFRDLLVQKAKDGNSVESAGPITLGYRLDSPETPEAWHTITYDKGAWIFHMLRRRLGDDRFFKMLAEFRRRYESRAASTSDLRALAKEFAPPRVSAASIDGFFDNWVYSTGIPTLKVTYKVKGAAPAVRITGQVEQSGVEDGFSVEAPVEVQFAKAASQIIWVETSNAGTSFTATVRQMPARVSIPVGTEILAGK
ncbi:MAG TPA: M1 family aminopeptidase [Bryobacteraceae bacterium]|jgi:hypothetical protein